MTLLFGLPSVSHRSSRRIYRGHRSAHRSGSAGQSCGSAASFFVSRIDVLVDPLLDKFIQHGEEGRAGEAGTRAGGGSQREGGLISNP